MARKIQRKVQAALIEKIGAVTAAELLEMADDSWGMLRDRISDRRNGGDGLTARCMACDSPVYIQSAPARGVTVRSFSTMPAAIPLARGIMARASSLTTRELRNIRAGRNRLSTAICVN
jgi:hypothetical protein